MSVCATRCAGRWPPENSADSGRSGAGLHPTLAQRIAGPGARAGLHPVARADGEQLLDPVPIFCRGLTSRMGSGRRFDRRGGAASPRPVGGDIRAVDGQATRRLGVDHGEHVVKRGPAAAALADDRSSVRRGNVEGHVLDGPEDRRLGENAARDRVALRHAVAP